MAVLWPAVASAFYTQAVSLLPAVKVFDGAAVTGDDPNDYLTVGHVTDDTAGTFSQTDGGDSNWVYEDGTLRSELVVQTGDDDRLDIVRTRASGYITTLSDWLRSNRTLGGILTADATVLLTAEAQSLKSAGTAQVFVVTLSYTSRAY